MFPGDNTLRMLTKALIARYEYGGEDLELLCTAIQRRLPSLEEQKGMLV